jgi:peptidoglycan hydrolase CwlO-like protein
MILFMVSAVTAFVTIPLVVAPAVRELTVAVDTEEDDPDLQIQESLRNIDSALTKMQTEEQNLQHGVRGVLEHIKTGSARIRELQNRRDKVMDELRRVEHLKALTDEQIAALGDRLHATQARDNIISFFVGIASSITAALALKFFVQSN